MAEPRTIVLPAEPLSPAAFAAFGSIVSAEGDKHAVAHVEFLWQDGHVNFISHARNEVGVGDIGLRCELLNRHDTHTQTLMPLDADAIVVVAPAHVDFSGPGDLDTVRAFFLRPHDGFHLRRGTWHWGPYPAHADRVALFNVQGTGYVRDNAIAHLSRDLGVTFEVDVLS